MINITDKLFYSQALKTVPTSNILLFTNSQMGILELLSPLILPPALNSVFRLIKYKHGHSLNAHYNSCIEKTNLLKTSHTLIFYLTANESRSTRLIKENPSNLKLKESPSEQITEIKESNIYQKINPKIGRLFMFEHYLLHDSAALKNEEKIIVITELFSSTPQ